MPNTSLGLEGNNILVTGGGGVGVGAGVCRAVVDAGARLIEATNAGYAIYASAKSAVTGQTIYVDAGTTSMLYGRDVIEKH